MDIEAERLGYSITSTMLMEGHVYKPSYREENSFVSKCMLPFAFDNLYERVGSIVIVVSHH